MIEIFRMNQFFLIILLMFITKSAFAFGWYVQETSAPSGWSYFAFNGNTSGCYSTVSQALNSLSSAGEGWEVLSINTTGQWSAYISQYTTTPYLITGIYGACNVPISGGGFPLFLGAAYDPTNSATTAPPVLASSGTGSSINTTITVASGETNQQASTVISTLQTEVTNQNSQIGQGNAIIAELSSIASSVSSFPSLSSAGVSSSFNYGLAGELWALPFCFMVGLYAITSNIGKFLKLIQF